jgi:hypothetical protein
MNAQAKKSAVAHLDSAAAMVRMADAYIQRGDSVNALQALQQAAWENQQISTALLRGCLGDVLPAILCADSQQREAYLPEFIRLLSFSMAFLCPDCRRQIGKQIQVATEEGS